MREIRISRYQKRTLQLLTLRRVVRGASMCEPYRLISRLANEEKHSDAPYTERYAAESSAVFASCSPCRGAVGGRWIRAVLLPSSLRPPRPHADPLGARLRKLPLHPVGGVGRHQRGDRSI